ncbi:MAG: mobile mystery protein B [Capsulimonas sp.]|uniref:mobile mystery protein B n=1 Tax=Capsulimonas sp. TaxID=2494211 RepID=UPI003265BEF3
MSFTTPEGATPLDPDILTGLIPDLTTQAELNEFEQINIAAAARWAVRSRTLKRDLLSESGLRLLHRRMFDLTWRWAGAYRQRDMNIGVDWRYISTQLVSLCGDTQYHIDNGVYPWDELAARFHHRLVLIHPFPNGNGRHARMAADLLLTFNQREPFTWGSGASLTYDGTVRRTYLNALRAADRGDFEALLDFIRS